MSFYIVGKCCYTLHFNAALIWLLDDVVTNCAHIIDALDYLVLDDFVQGRKIYLYLTEKAVILEEKHFRDAICRRLFYYCAIMGFQCV